MRILTCPCCGHSAEPKQPLIYGNVVIEDVGRLFLNGIHVGLTPTLFKLASNLIAAKGRGLFKEHLASLIDPDLDHSAVVTYMTRLKNCFRQIDPAFDQLETIRGLGAYRWKEVSASGSGAVDRDLTDRNHYCQECGYQMRPFEPIELGNVSIYEVGHVYFDGRPIHLAPTQYIIADALIRARGKGVCQSTLANLIDPDIEQSAVKSYILRLREAFRQVSCSFDQVECLKGFGTYRGRERPNSSDYLV